MYGISETTVRVTFYRLEAVDFAGSASPIGRPLLGTSENVLKRHLPATAEGARRTGGPSFRVPGILLLTSSLSLGAGKVPNDVVQVQSHHVPPHK